MIFEHWLDNKEPIKINTVILNWHIIYSQKLQVVKNYEIMKLSLILKLKGKFSLPASHIYLFMTLMEF